jgi:hypothetical protein
VGVAHLPLDLGPRHQRRHRVDDHHVHGVAPDEHLGDLEGLLSRVGLRDQQVVHVHSELPGILHVQGVLGVDERGDAPGALSVRDDVKTQGRLPG